MQSQSKGEEYLRMDAWGRTVAIPMEVLRGLVIAEATSAAHHQLCFTRDPAGLIAHPGDPFGKVLGWLWLEGLEAECLELVAGYLSEMRNHNPHRSKDGQRLTWDALKAGIKQAISPRLSDEQVGDLVQFLDENVPDFYGEAPKRLNTP